MINRMMLLAGAALAGVSCATAPQPQTTITGDYLSGRLAAGLNDIDAAADRYGAAVVDRPDNEDLVRSAFLYHLAAGEIDAAAPFAEKLAASKDRDGLAQFALAAIRLKRGDLIGARALLQQQTAEPFTKSIAFLAGGWIEAELSGPAAGVTAFDLGKDVFTGFNPTFKAILLEEKGEIEAAREQHELSVATFGGPVGREAYGAFLERHGPKEAALDYYAVLAKDGGASRRLAQAAQKRISRNAPSKAYTDISAAEGAAIGLYLFAGNLLQQSAEELQRAAEAGFKVSERPFNLPLALTQIAVYLDPKFSEAQRLVGSIHNIYGNYAAARAAFAKVPAGSAQYELAQTEIAGSLEAENRSEEAIDVLRSVVRRDKYAEDALLTLAGLYASKERHRDAVDAASAAIARLGEEPPEDAWRHFVTRAASLIELDRFPEAEADLKRAVEIDPEEPVALNYLGYSWVERGVNLEEAFALIEKAVALRPQSGAIIDSLGWAHYQRGEYDLALPHLEKAASLEPADPTITDHLGDAYWRLGREVEARFQWARALELKPAERTRAAIEEKLKSGLSPKTPKTADKS